MQKNRLTFTLTLLVLLTIHGESGAESLRKPIVFTTIAPHAYMVERIGGDRIDVETMIPPGSSPHSFEPTAGQIARVADAGAYFKSGIEAETTLVPRLASLNRRLKLFDINRGIELNRIDDSHARVHGERRDPHVWLSPRLAKREAENICEGLIKIDAANEREYRKNLAALLEDLDRLDGRIAARMRPFKGKSFYVYHPSFGYFAAEYGLRQVAVEAGGREPGARGIAELIRKAKKDGIRIIFVEPQFPAKPAKLIAESIGGKAVTIDPLSRNYIVNLEEISMKISDALTTEGGGR